MTELDFDELDKAVNSLMANVDTTKRPEGLDDPEDKVVALDTPTSENPLDSPIPAPSASTSTTNSVASQQNTPTPPPAAISRPMSAPAIKRSGGQFMDIVRPSSASKSPVAGPVKREGPVIEPVNPTPINTLSADIDTAPSLAATAPTLTVEPMEATTAQYKTSTESTLSLAAESNNIAQSADQTSFSQDSPIDTVALVDTTTSEIIEPATEQQPDTSLRPDDVTLQDTPLTTPFIVDAKVEKRPLGANSTEHVVADSAAFELSGNNDDAVSSASELDEDRTPDIELPKELDADIASIESTNVVPATPVSPAAGRATPTVPVETIVPGGGSIPQQYTEQKSTGDQTNGSIYDTANYHQPIDAVAPKKKSSSLKWVIWVLVLLIIGAIAGAAYFYFTR